MPSSPSHTTSNVAAHSTSDRPRTPLQERLGTLLSTSSSPRSSNELSRPITPASSGSSSRERLQGMLPKLRPLRTPTSFFTPSAEPPVARTLGNTHRRGVSLQNASPSTEAALRDAIDDESLFSPSKLIACPPIARLAPPRDLRNPQLLHSLTRSTLPSAHLTTVPPAIHIPEPSRSTDEPQLLPEQSPPTRTSIESLRTLQDRRKGQQTPNTSPQKAEFSTSALSRWWYQPENKAAVDRLLDEEDQENTAEQERDKHRQKYLAPENPVVFCHGLLGFDTVKVGPIYPLQVSHWRGIKEVLEANGVEVLITRVPATSSIEERAKVLEKTVSEAYSGRSVHLIGHSMGGLDCRYLATHLKTRAFKVLSVTTLATPHRGSAFADHFITTIGRERLPSVVSLLDLLPNGGGDGSAFESLTLESMKEFNESTPDEEGVRYFSWGAEATPGLLDPFRWPHSVILEKEGPNDGLVSVESAKWGTYLGTLQDVNHLDLIGWINNTRYKWAEWTGKEIKFKPATFYLGVTDYIAKAVEDQTREAGSQKPSHTSADSGVDQNIAPDLDVGRNSTSNSNSYANTNGIEDHDHAESGAGVNLKDGDNAGIERNIPAGSDQSEAAGARKREKAEFLQSIRQNHAELAHQPNSNCSPTKPSLDSAAQDKEPHDAQPKPDLPGVVIKEIEGSHV